MHSFNIILASFYEHYVKSQISQTIVLHLIAESFNAKISHSEAEPQGVADEVLSIPHIAKLLSCPTKFLLRVFTGSVDFREDQFYTIDNPFLH